MTEESYKPPICRKCQVEYGSAVCWHCPFYAGVDKYEKDKPDKKDNNICD